MRHTRVGRLDADINDTHRDVELLRQNAGGGTTGAHAWLGLGQPLAWWLLGAYGVGGLAVNSWELSSAEFDRLCSRGGTGAWGADTQFQSLQELLDWAEYGSVVSHVEVSSSWLVVIIYVVVET